MNEPKMGEAEVEEGKGKARGKKRDAGKTSAANTSLWLLWEV